jgi:hypothetical protein
MGNLACAAGRGQPTDNLPYNGPHRPDIETAQQAFIRCGWRSNDDSAFRVHLSSFCHQQNSWWSTATRWQWTWIDGRVASCGPRNVWRKKASGGFVAGGVEVSSGVVTYQHFGIAAIAGVEWAFGDQSLSDVPWGCCGGMIKQSNRLLAAWRRCPRVEIAIRDNIPGSLQCICIGMVLTQSFD